MLNSRKIFTKIKIGIIAAFIIMGGFFLVFSSSSAEPEFTVSLNPDSAIVEQGESTNTIVSVTEQPNESSGGVLTISLAPDTPTFSLVVENAWLVPFTKINLSASGNSVLINSLIVERNGISQDSNFRSLILVDSDGFSPISDEEVLGPNHRVTFDEPILIETGQTKSIYLAANTSPTMNTAEMASLDLVDVELNGDAVLSGSLPVAGNDLMTNGSVAITSLTLSAGSQNPAASTQRVGTSDYVFTSARLVANSVEDTEVVKMRFHNGGTIVSGDVEDFDLTVDGSVVANLPEMTNDELIFDLSNNPIRLNRGTIKEFSLRGDIVSGVGRYASFDFQKRTDVIAKGLEYGFYAAPTYPNTISPVFNANDTMIAAGDLAIFKGDLDSLSVTANANDQTIGAFKFQSFGELVDVSSVVFEVKITPTDTIIGNLTNFALYNNDGKVAAGPLSPSKSTIDTYEFTFNDSFTVPIGSNSYNLKANLDNIFSSGDQIQVKMINPSLNVIAQGHNTNKLITAIPSTDISSDTVTVNDGLSQLEISNKFISSNILKNLLAWLGVNQAKAASPVTLSVTGLPEGVLANFSPNNLCDPNCSVELTLKTSANSPSGEYSIVVTGNRSNITRQSIFSLTIIDSGNNEDGDGELNPTPELRDRLRIPRLGR